MLRSSNIQNSKLDFNDNVFVNSNVVPSKIRTKNNDVLMCVRNGSRNLVGKTALITKNYENLAWGAFMNIIRPLEKNNYLYFFLNSEVFKKQIYKDLATATVNQITMQTLNDIKLFLPTIEEQNKIADFLSLVDKRIEKQRQLVENLKKYKRGYLKNIISQISATKYLIKNIVSEYTEKTTINEQYPILSSTLSGIKLQENYFNKQAASENTIGYKIVPKGYFTYRSMSDTGIFRFNCQNLIEKGIVSPAYPVFTLNNDHNSVYFEYILNETDYIKQQLLTAKEGGTRYALSFSKFQSLSIELPELCIQNKIAHQINFLNLAVEKEELILTKILLFKQGLLQQMFI